MLHPHESTSKTSKTPKNRNTFVKSYFVFSSHVSVIMVAVFFQDTERVLNVATNSSCWGSAVDRFHCRGRGRGKNLWKSVIKGLPKSVHGMNLLSNFSILEL